MSAHCVYTRSANPYPYLSQSIKWNDGDMTDQHSTGLVRYDAMCRAIDEAYEIDEVKSIHDQAAMLQAAAKVASNHDAEMRAYEIRMRAARKAGELSKKIAKALGARTDLSAQTGEVTKGSVLEDAGTFRMGASF